jgi:hypothetical protein
MLRAGATLRLRSSQPSHAPPGIPADRPGLADVSDRRVQTPFWRKSGAGVADEFCTTGPAFFQFKNLSLDSVVTTLRRWILDILDPHHLANSLYGLGKCGPRPWVQSTRQPQCRRNILITRHEIPLLSRRQRPAEAVDRGSAARAFRCCPRGAPQDGFFRPVGSCCGPFCGYRRAWPERRPPQAWQA